MTLTADSGSTKTTWLIKSDADHDATSLRFSTQGINPFHLSNDEITNIIKDELLCQIGFPKPKEITAVHFYGAGCTTEKSQILSAILRRLFSNASSIEVGSDMLGAARALLGNTPGIACILGTGANSCLYDGNDIIGNVSPMGYILGDEGSGAVLGRTFINLLYKGEHRDFIPVFEQETGLYATLIIEKVYRSPMPNRFLASLAPFIKAHINSEEWIEEMVTDCFRLFFRRNVCHYHHDELPCSFVGSIAYYFEEQLLKAAMVEGFHIGKVMKEPF